MKVEILTITPEMASEFLTHNVGNRTPKKHNIDKYAQLMKAGKWELTHQGIAFDESGRLMDGQNRLFAVVKSGVPVEMMVTYGMKAETNRAIDDGAVRSIRDYMRFLGEESYMQSHNVVAAMRVVMMKTVDSTSSPAKTEVMDFMMENRAVCRFIYNVECVMRKNRSAQLFSTLIGAGCAGIDFKHIYAFAELLGNNTLPNNGIAYNNKAVIDLNDYLSARGGIAGAGNSAKQRELQIQKAFYLFYENKKRFPNGFDGKIVYPIYRKTFKAFNTMLEAKYRLDNAKTEIERGKEGDEE